MKAIRIVHLEVKKGKKTDLGDHISEKSVVKIQYNTIEWKNYMKNIVLFGAFKVKVLAVFEKTKDGYEKEDSFPDIEGEVSKFMKTDVSLSEYDKMKEKMKRELMEELGLKKPSEDGLEDARRKYKDHFGKNPHHAAKEDKILSDIEDDIEKNK